MSDRSVPYGYNEVELHSAEASAVEATKATIEGLGIGAGPKPFLEEGGRFFIRVGFATFAAERQGYVKRVLR